MNLASKEEEERFMKYKIQLKMTQSNVNYVN